MANYSIPYAAQLTCRDSNTTIPEPPFLAGPFGLGAPGTFGAAGNGSRPGNGTWDGKGAACALSEFQPGAAVLLNMCCNTTAPGANGVGVVTKANTRLHNNLHPAQTGGYDLGGCSWRYCNVTGEEGVKNFERCMQTQSVTRSKNVRAKCFVGKNGAAGTVVGTAVGGNNSIGKPLEVNHTSGGDRIQWRTEKKKQTTVSAALLLALGVAGIVLGS